MALLHHLLKDASYITAMQLLDAAANGATLSAMAGGQAISATGQVKGLLNKAFWPSAIKGFAGVTAPEIKSAWNAMTGTVLSAGITCSLSFLMRVHTPQAGTVMRWESGSYIYTDAAGALQLDGSATYQLTSLAELGGTNIWRRVTLVRGGGATFIVYLDNANLRTITRNLNLAAGVFDLMAYQSTRAFPGGADVTDIRVYNHALTTEEIAALVTADGSNPAGWPGYYHPSGNDLSCGCLHGEQGLQAGGYTGYTYFDITNPGPGNMTKIWTNNNSCRYGKTYWVGSKTELYTEFEFYIPSENVMEKNGSAPSFIFNFIQFQKSNYITDIGSNYILQVNGIWEDPGAGARLRRYRITWYDSSAVAHNIDFPDADIPTNRKFTVKVHVLINGASSKINVTIDGEVFDEVTADFTGVANIASVGAGPYNGVHQAIKTGSDSYAIYMGKQYVGDTALSSIPIKQLKHYYSMQEVA